MGPPPRPTDAELSILRVLWKIGPATVRAVHEVLQAERPVNYTTALKLLQIMTDKGLVTRDESARSHVYAAAQPEAETQGSLVRDLLDKAFAGSTSRLVMRALEERPASADELSQLRTLLERLERRGGS
ncbi:BlaI/MecI/CopY family transcriptional regulator [Nannocystis sp. ILAH1]|uniref:BlaI/MecI/CopY family transcriptional regulator n=1 Tax=unclassified Nannocystis TaxID=2627009 RepID=UPI002271FD35|nr:MULTISPECIES: BlaI/MecI/CopY family transcriptional regulator [unclassified Nannocystis]MCY0991030.1 BlaI/MecI/CopY family transcriptional regulator [Nannocystis sp. ILAH1]MCY1064535.1 BlaI/MecI/CopY family transcriptional regulator [Nannocystis sp. RBIL2]